MGTEPIQDPFIAKSPSGRTTLWVNPDEPRGVCACTCIAKRNGKILWTKRFPFWFEAAGITELGVLGGYGYISEGKEVKLIAAISDISGTLKVVKKLNFNKDQLADTLPMPRWKGLIFDAANDRMVLRISGLPTGDWTESWLVYSLSKAQQIDTIQPKHVDDSSNDSISAAKLVKGTNLIIASWYHYDRATSKTGQCFTLVDPASKTVWRTVLPDDLDVSDHNDRRGIVWTAIMSGGALLDADQSGRFEIRAVKSASRITFQVRQDGTNWHVSEVARRKYLEPNEAKPSLATKARPFRVVASLVIRCPAGKPTSIHNVGPFGFWGNRIVFLRNGETPEICVVDKNGSLVRQISIPKLVNSDGDLFLTKTFGSKFILASRTNESPVSSYVWSVDVATGAFSRLLKIDSTGIIQIAGISNGRIAVISSEDYNGTVIEQLSLYDPSGKLNWKIGEMGYSGRKSDLLSPTDIAIDSSGRIVVLDVIQHTLQFFSQEGRFVSRIELDKSLGRHLEYPTKLTCLPNGDIWVLDMGDKPGYLFDKHGRLVRSHPLKFGNGRRIELREGMRLDTQSRHWISTGNELDRLDDFGTVVQSVGNQPRRAGLGKISHLKVGTDGRIYALDAETSGVHVFDWKGHSLFTCQPKPKEFAAESSQLDVTRSGDIYIEGSYLDGSLHYSPAGKRMGYVPFADGTGRELAVSPKPTWRWFGSELIDERSKVVTRLRRFPDQRWMTGEIAMAPDGRIAAYERPSYFERQGQPLRLAFYTMATRPEGQVFLPAEMPEVFGCAYDGNRCYFVTQKGLLAVDRKGKLVWRYQPPNWTTEWKAFPSMGKIALYDGDHTVRWIEKGPAK